MMSYADAHIVCHMSTQMLQLWRQILQNAGVLLTLQIFKFGCVMSVLHLTSAHFFPLVKTDRLSRVFSLHHACVVLHTTGELTPDNDIIFRIQEKGAWPTAMSCMVSCCVARKNIALKCCNDMHNITSQCCNGIDVSHLDVAMTCATSRCKVAMASAISRGDVAMVSTTSLNIPLRCYAVSHSEICTADLVQSVALRCQSQLVNDSCKLRTNTLRDSISGAERGKLAGLWSCRGRGGRKRQGTIADLPAIRCSWSWGAFVCEGHKVHECLFLEICTFIAADLQTLLLLDSIVAFSLLLLLNSTNHMGCRHFKHGSACVSLIMHSSRHKGSNPKSQKLLLKPVICMIRHTACSLVSSKHFAGDVLTVWWLIDKVTADTVRDRINKGFMLATAYIQGKNKYVPSRMLEDDNATDSRFCFDQSPEEPQKLDFKLTKLAICYENQNLCRSSTREASESRVCGV